VYSDRSGGACHCMQMRSMMEKDKTEKEAEEAEVVEDSETAKVNETTYAKSRESVEGFAFADATPGAAGAASAGAAAAPRQAPPLAPPLHLHQHLLRLRARRLARARCTKGRPPPRRQSTMRSWGSLPLRATGKSRRPTTR